MADQNSTASESVEAQLRAFVVEFQPWLFAQALRICRDNTEAQDLVQTASERFLENLSRLRHLQSRTKLEGWFIITMTNEFISRCLKRSSEKKGRLDPTLVGRTLGKPSEPKRLLSEFEEGSAMDAALEKLSPTLRSTMELHLQGKSYQEISQIQGILTGTVGKRLSDAREKLMTLLEPFFSSRKH